MEQSILGFWRALLSAAFLLLLGPLSLATLVAQELPWPAEPEESAKNLSDLTREFRKDLSGAVWNPVTRTLWVCRNGPKEDSGLWSLVEGNSGSLQIASDRKGLAEWRKIGDCEGVTFADFEERVVYLIIEGEERIHELDVSTHGKATLARVYDTSPFLPLDGSMGAEGITFVPDENLTRSGFVDSNGSPRQSRGGMGGLMFVGHQNGGGIFAFDLNRATGAVDFVGEYRVISGEGSEALSRTVGLEFDRSTDRLFAWHSRADSNVLSELKLSSEAVPGESFRAFQDPRLFTGPSARNCEGLAIAAMDDCGPLGRALYLTIDDGKSHSLFHYAQFGLGCEEQMPAADGASSDGEERGDEFGADVSAANAKAPAEAKGPDLWAMLFSLVGGLGIFLVGMKHMSEGMQAIAGNRLRQMINAVTDNRFLAVGVGTGVTCLVQSSSITTVIVVGFVNSGLMQLKQAIGVIMGANIGTTITGWILVLKVGKYGLPILGLSAFFYLFSKRERWRYIAMATMGLGMVFFGLELMKNGVKPMRSVPAFQDAFAWFVADSYIGVLKCASLGCILTFLVQSSSATLGITISLAVTGTIPFETAAALVLGENVGTTITAWMASLGATTVAKRAAYAHIVFNLIGVFWITLIFQFYIHLIGRFVELKSGVDIFSANFSVDNSEIAFATTITFAIAAVHTGFNITNTALFVGFLTPFSRLLERVIPDRSGNETPHLKLDFPTLTSPVLAVHNSRAAIIKMAGEVRDMFAWTRDLVESERPDQALADEVFHYERVMDEVQAEVIEFLTNILSAETPHEVAIEARQQLRIVDEYESVSDYISTILKARLRIDDRGLSLSSADRTNLLALHDEVSAYLHAVSAGFKDPHARDLAQAVNGSNAIRRTVKKLRSAHLDSLSEGDVDPALSMAFSTILNGYRKVKEHALNIAESYDA